MSNRLLPLLLLTTISLTAQGQQEVRIGQHRYTPPANTDALYAPTRSEAATSPRHLLIQFSTLPTAIERKQLSNNGIRLHEYHGSNTFAATVDVRQDPQLPANANIVAAFTMQPEWKISAQLAEGRVPPHALTASGQLLVLVHFSPTMTEAEVSAQLRGLGLRAQRIDSRFFTIHMQLSRSGLNRLAQLPWVQAIKPTPAPQQLYNRTGRGVIKANVLSTAPELHGRGLTGHGVRVGIWDGNVAPHPDYGSRLHQQEFEMSIEESGGHGMHVAGTVAGAGLIDPAAMGMAPEADFYTYNFNVQSNGLYAFEEMAEARERFGINITQNSYGVYMDNFCDDISPLTYNAFGQDAGIDHIANLYPSLLHLFAAGNEQQSCGFQYGSSTTRLKNALIVGAVNSLSGMTDFSSWGPMDDGRLLPTVCAMGEAVYSTMPGGTYARMDGTSMATPAASGLMALLVERYRQLHNGHEPLSALMRAVAANTADDRGRPGPDYQFGYGVLNGERAAQTIENSWYTSGYISQGDADATHTIAVPAGTRQLRVMLSWTDTISTHEHYFGEPALVNDLDLTVNGHQPWVLDKDFPDNDATQGRDTLNNLEQVTIDHPAAGDYIVKVHANRVVSSRQQYVVVYHIEREGLRLASPVGGERLAPGDEMLVRWYNAEMPVTIELSYDGGQSYTAIACDVAPELQQLAIDIPSDAPATSSALLRVSDGKGVAVSAAPFTIAGVPRLTLTAQGSGCSEGGYVLSWNDIPEATEYRVLRADVAQGSYLHIATVNSNQYSIENQHISNNEHNVFAVQAVYNGIVGRRSLAARVKSPQPIELTGNTLPFKEIFALGVPQHVELTAGANLSEIYGDMPSYFEPELGERYYMVTPDTNAHDGATVDAPFDGTESNQVVLRLCNIDLTGIAAGTPIMLHFNTMSRRGSDPRTTSMRVRIDGQPVPDIDGAILHHPKQIEESTWTTHYYDLSAYVGQTLSIAIEAAMLTTYDGIGFAHIVIDKMAQQPDLQIAGMQSVQSGHNLGNNNPVSITLFNRYHQALHDVLVSYSINGQHVVTEIIKEIKPYQQLSYTFGARADLSTANDLGERFYIEAMADINDDVDISNNTALWEVSSYGNTFVLPYAELIDAGIFGKNSTDAKTVKRVDGSLLFTDDGGAFGSYRTNNQSSVRFVPTNPDKVIRITFQQFDTEYEYDVMSIWTNALGFPGYVGTEPDYMLSDVCDGRAFVSGASDGGLCLTFYSDESFTADGWVALVEEIDPVNMFAIRLHPMAYEPTGQVPVTITVKNLSDSPVANVDVAFVLDNNRVEEQIPSIAPHGSVDYTFTEFADLSELAYHTLSVMVLSSDAMPIDNRVDTMIINDIYCRIDEIANPERVNITGVEMLEGEYYSFYEAASTHVDYQTASTFTAYMQNAELAQLTVYIDNPSRSDAIGVAVDWDDDGSFEQVGMATLRADEYVYTIDLNNGMRPGEHRMRVGVMNASILDPCPAGAISYGSIKDFTLNVIDGTYPMQNDFGIEIEALISGVNLIDAEMLSVVITNNSPNAAAPGLVEVDVDGVTFTEDVTEAVVPFGVLYYDFAQSIDLSAAGEHHVTARLLSPDDDSSNDMSAVDIHNVVPASDGFYAIEMLNADDEHINLGNLNGISFDAMTFTLEAWVKLHPASVNNIFRGKDVVVAVMNRPEIGVENAVVVSFGGQSVFYTDNDVFVPNMWQHVAVSVEPIEHQMFGEYPRPTIYINGVAQELFEEDAHMGYMSETYDKELFAAHRMGGVIKAIRVWETSRTASDIAADMYRLVRQPHGDLPFGCVAEFALDEGPGNSAVHSGYDIATLVSSRGDAVWADPADLVARMNFEEQTEPVVRHDKQSYTVLLDSRANLSSVAGHVQPAWPNATITYNGQPIDGPATFDFGSGTIALQAQAQLFGRNIGYEISISGQHDASNECSLLRLVALGGHGSSDAHVTPIAATNIIELWGLSDLTAVDIDFEVSPGATLLYNGMAYSNGDALTIDLSQTVMLTVVAADGKHRQCYSLANVRANSISGLQRSYGVTYGIAPWALGATAASGLPVEYASSNNRVATVSNGQLHIVGAGEAIISAYQDGGNGFGPAAPATCKVTVDVKAVLAKPLDQHISYIDTLPSIQMQYTGLVNDADMTLIQIPEYELFVDGVKYDPLKGYLPQGSHDWRPVVASGYQGNYYVFFDPARVHVASWPAVSTIIAVESGGNPVSDAHVTLCSAGRCIEHSTSISGQTPSIDLEDGTTYSYTAQADGYAAATDEFIAGTSPTVSIELLALAHTLTYTANAHGAIHGKSAQRVPNHGTGLSVEAIPVRGYSFTRWSDGSTQNPRTDTNVQSDMAVEAQFSLNIYTVEYLADANGSLSGELAQTIDFEKNGTPVTAIPNANYRFVGWSDGRTDNPRIDMGSANMQVTALFEYAPEVLIALPYAQHFEDSPLMAMPDGWYVEDYLATGSTERWRVLADYIGMARMTGNFALIGTYIGENSEANAALLSPWFNVSNLTAADTLHVDFRYMYAGFAPTAHFGLSYRTHPDSAWTAMWAASNHNETPLDVLNAALSLNWPPLGQANKLQLCWSYTDQQGYWAALDSLHVYATTGSTLHQLTINVMDSEAKPIEGATITIEGRTLTTDAIGTVSDRLQPGTYIYTVEKVGYGPASGSVALSCDTMIKVTLGKAAGQRSPGLNLLSVHPNPTTGELWLTVPEPVEGTIEGTATAEVLVYNASGQLLLRVPTQGASTGPAHAAGRIGIDLSGLPAGIYIVRMGSSAAKVVKI